ncbi:MAG: two pore domain potassium channel family protein [Planctomycetia bacterium]|nr:two pore domain potassium channel family protein [Planctomycetia bacterium]
MWQWHMRTMTWVAAYLVAVASFAVVYLLLPAGQFSQPLTLLDAVYFSVITITTTGFGDITAHGGLAKLFVSLEATAGLAIAGLFLASLWRDFTLRVESAQESRLRHGARAVDLATLHISWQYVGSAIEHYRELSAAITSAPLRRNGASPRPSVAAGAARPLLDRYFDAEDRLESDLKYLLANAVVVEFPEVRTLLFTLLSLLRASDARESLAGMPDDQLQAEMHEVLASPAAGTAPAPDRHGTIAAVAVLARHVRHTTEALDALTSAMVRLLAAVPAA